MRSNNKSWMMNYVKEKSDPTAPVVSNEYKDSNSLKMIAHRGMSDYVPENSIPAFECAGMFGFWGCETDIQETLDGKFIAMHDDTIDRTTTGNGKVSEMTYADIRMSSIDGGNYIENCKDTTIPNLSEYLHVCLRFNMVPVIEIKKLLSVDSVERLINEIEAITDDYMLICFDIQYLLKAKEINPSIPCQFLINFAQPSATLDICKLNNIMISCSISLIATTSFMEDISSRGIKLGVWTATTKDNLFDVKDLNLFSCSSNSIIDYDNARMSNCIDLSGSRSFPLDVIHGQWLNAGSKNCFKGEMISNTVETRAISKNLIKLNGRNRIKVSLTDQYSITMVCFDVNGDMLKDMGWFTQGDIYNLHPNCCYMIPYAKLNSGLALVEDDFKAIESMKIELWHEHQWSNVL